MVISYLYNLFKNSQITQKQYNVLILDTFFERKPLIFNDFRFSLAKTAPKLHRFKNFPARFLHRLTLISEIAPIFNWFFSSLEQIIAGHLENSQNKTSFNFFKFVHKFVHSCTILHNPAHGQ